MSLKYILLMLLLVGLMASGQLLFKLTARLVSLPEVYNFKSVLSVLLNPFLLLSLAVYGVATLLWVWILRDADLSRAYPFVAITLVLVPIGGIVFFGESFSPALIYGGLLILAGVAVISIYS